LGKIAITLIAAIFLASTQCIAACAGLPCDLPQATPASDCHHKAPPADHHHDQSACGHPVFLSDIAPQPSAVAFHHADLSVIAISPVDSIPETFVLLESAADHSPPPLLALPAPTIFRI
jgi:hypothetical protein